MSPGDYSVVDVTELPPWYTRERYVNRGYRRCRTLKACACSAFRLHNQTVNVWLHLPTSLLLLPYAMYQMSKLTHSDDTMDAQVVYVSVIFGNVTTLLVSSMSHLFFCYNRRVHNICWFADFVGLLVGILGGGIGLGYFSFRCHPRLLGTYAATMATAFPLVLRHTWNLYTSHVGTLPLVPDDSFPEFVMPLGVFNLLSWISVLVIDKVYLSEYTNMPLFEKAWNTAAMCPIILLTGALIHYLNFPESLLPPGTVDIIGHSHQLWHVCAAALMVVWIHAVTQYYDAHVTHPCAVRGQ